MEAVKRGNLFQEPAIPGTVVISSEINKFALQFEATDLAKMAAGP